ncbi:MAG: aminotransferase class IV [Bacteroidia bacterium]|nr:aminotransferase class IV [Bacteroidia bacterium]
MELNYCIYNGHLASLYEPFLSFNNRAFRLGDSVFESIRVFDGGYVPLLDKHIWRLKMGMSVFKMKIPPEFSLDYFKKLIQTLYHENHCRGDVRLRLTVFRNGEGNYIPPTNDVSFLMQLYALENPDFELNQEGYWLEVYTECRKPVTKYSNFKSGSAMFYVQAGIFCSSTGINECLIVNEYGNICEALYSNIFLVKGNFLHTPPAEEGGVLGVMKQTIIELAPELKLMVSEKPITLNHIHSADECFLTNAVQGIRWVHKFREKFFTKNTTVEIFQLLKKRLSQQ